MGICQHARAKLNKRLGVFKPSKEILKTMKTAKILQAGEYFTNEMYEQAFEDIKETIEEEIANNQVELDKLNEAETK
jgi:hypothetical protein